MTNPGNEAEIGQAIRDAIRGGVVTRKDLWITSKLWCNAHGCASQGIHVTAYAPLGSGDRPDFVKARDAPVLLEDPLIGSIAEARGCTPAQVLIAWQVQQGISVVPKSVTPSRLADNLAAGKLELTQAELERIAGLDRGYRMIAGDFWVVKGTPWTRQTIWDEA